MPLRIILGAATGVLVGLALHFLVSPAIGGSCAILCRPERAALAGLLIGGLVAFIHGRGEAKKTREAPKSEDPPAGGAS